MLPFIKMHGAGNDYVYLDERDTGVLETDHDVPAMAMALADRHFGIGGDGLILIRKSDVADARMQMFNADGSESEMCGNGLRCVAKVVHDEWYKPSERPDQLKLETGNGVLVAEIVQRDADGLAEQVRISMGPPILEPARIPTTLDPSVAVPIEVDTGDLPELAGVDLRVTAVSMGNPHAVLFFDDPAAITDRVVHTLGPRIEHHPAFPNRVNVEFVTTPSRSEFTQRTWERGSGETLACGTGACAVGVAGVLTGRLDRTVTGHLVGGDLTIEWPADESSVLMTGGAVVTFVGQVALPA